MAWVAATNLWIYVTASSGVNRSISPTTTPADIRYQGSSYAYKSNKYYYYITDVTGNFTTNGVTFSVRPAYLSKNPGSGISTPTNGVVTIPANASSPDNGRYFNVFQPTANATTNDVVKYQAQGGSLGLTGSLLIQHIKVQEIGWKISGYKQFGRGTTSSSFSDISYSGWSFDSEIDTFWWMHSPTPTIGMTGLSIAGSESSNFIGKQISYDKYNIFFQYQTFLGNYNDGINVYTAPSELGTKQLIASITASSSPIIHTIYGLTGGGTWVFFVGRGTTSSGFGAALTNISIEGGYHPDNNEQFLFTNGSTYSDPTQLQILGLTSATYSFIVGYGDTIANTFSSSSLINSKFGNGTFRAGIWENGVWNSGWRVDQNVHEFDSVYLGIKTIADRRWRIQIDGPTASAAAFEIGEKVSIGNIVAIDINEQRKLLKGYFTIINKTSNSLIVEIDTNFPYRRIEKDSDFHKIKITKNVWLSGGFLNGYFSGVWNYGLFKGFPKITEMYNTHWIDGVFDGGHYNSVYATASFNGTTASGTNLGLTFSNGHSYVVGDIITIDKTNKLINPQYDGTASVISVVNNKLLITDKIFGSYSAGESGLVTNSKANAVIQNFRFYDNNVAKKVSAQSTNTEEVFQFYSWIDVNYYNTSAVNIGKPVSLFDVLTRTEYSQNNLYGYPTSDVLSSVSTFRDSYSNNKRNYKLGTKYRIYNDFIGQGSEFDRPFDMGTESSPVPGPAFQGVGLDTFIEYGWTFSIATSSTYTNSRSLYYRSKENQDQQSLDIDESLIIKGEELVIDSHQKGSVLNNTNIDIEKLRYSIVEFDMITYSVSDPDATFIASLLDKTAPNSPVLHFNNVNTYLTNTSVFFGFPFFATFSFPTWIDATYLPVYENVNHVLTPGIKKYEYFYNKTSMSLNTLGSGTSGDGTFSSTIDNLKFYEIDMIPFFQYFIEDNIYNGVVVPYQGIAPFIDYTDSNFSFIDNINIGLSSISTQQSFTPISGVGVGIGGGGINPPIFTPDGGSESK